MPSDHRLHPASVFFALGAQLRTLALPAVLFLFSARSSDFGWQLFGLLFLVPTGIAAALRWWTFRYRYEESELAIRSGLLFKNERHIPYHRIQNLDAVENLFHRAFGVVEARVHTGSGKEPEARLSVLPKADFEEMRRRVFAGKQQATATAPTDGESDAAAAEASPAEPPRLLLHLPPRELALAGLIQSRGGVVLAGLFGLLWEIGYLDRRMGDVVGEDAPGKGVVRDFLGSLFSGDVLPLGRVGALVAGIVGLMVTLRLISMVWTTVRLWDYRVSRVGDDLRTEYGSFTRVAATIPLHRIQTVTLRENLLHRLFDRVSLKVDTAGADGAGEGGQKQREWLAPLLKKSELPRLLGELMPGLELDSVAWQPLHPRAFSREMKGGVIVSTLATLPFVYNLKIWSLVPFSLFVFWAWISARQNVRHMRWATAEGHVYYKSGWLTRQLSLAPFGKVQGVSLSESPWDRRRGMMTLNVDTAGASDLHHRLRVPYLPKETALELATRLAAEAEGRAFRW